MQTQLNNNNNYIGHRNMLENCIRWKRHFPWYICIVVVSHWNICDCSFDRVFHSLCIFCLRFEDRKCAGQLYMCLVSWYICVNGIAGLGISGMSIGWVFFGFKNLISHKMQGISMQILLIFIHLHSTLSMPSNK